MASLRREIVPRSLGRVTPKLHLLECHVVPFMRKFKVGLGLLAEHGAKSIHKEFNTLLLRHGGIVDPLQRLRVTVQQHLIAALPSLRPLVPAPRKRSRKEQS